MQEGQRQQNGRSLGAGVAQHSKPPDHPLRPAGRIAMIIIIISLLLINNSNNKYCHHYHHYYYHY